MTETTQKPKRELWPIAIGAILVLFVLGVVSMAVFSTSQKADLVVRDYYDAGLAHQQQVESEQRAGEGGAPFVVTRLSTPYGIRLDFADRFRDQSLAGSIQLYRPSNSGHDRRMDLVLDADARQVIEMANLPGGYWKVKVVWTFAGEEYYHEEGFVLGR